MPSDAQALVCIIESVEEALEAPAFLICHLPQGSVASVRVGFDHVLLGVFAPFLRRVHKTIGPDGEAINAYLVRLDPPATDMSPKTGR